MTDWSILGGDPAPGATEAFQAIASALGPIVSAAESSGNSIRAMAQQVGSVAWSGIAADAFAESVHAIPNDLEELVDAHQTAIRGLTDYAGTLTILQQQAAQVLSNALSAQSAADAASSRLSVAESSYSDADGQYWFHRGKVDVLEVAKEEAALAGEHATVSRLAGEIASAVEARNTAWTRRAAAALDIQTAQAALAAARREVADEQAGARQIVAEREAAAQTLAGLLAAASEFVVGKRSWIDRVRREFDSIAGFNWRHVEEDFDGAAHGLVRGLGDIDGFVRVHAETVRDAAEIVNRYAADVSFVANYVAPYFTVVALTIDAVSAGLPPPADAVGFELGNQIGNVPNYVAAEADTVGTEAALVAMGADELAEVPTAQRLAQFEADKLSLEESSTRVVFDYTNIAIGEVLPDSHQVTSELIDGGPIDTVRAISNLEAQNYVIPKVENTLQSRAFGQ